MVSGGATVAQLEAAYRTPIYRRAEAARLLGVPESTLRNWARGYSFKRLGGDETNVGALITTAPPSRGRGPSIPFVGLAESYTLAAFRRAGVSMQRIRPALKRLEKEIGLPQALASRQLMTDGADVLWEYRKNTSDPSERDAVEGLVVVSDGQYVFREVVEDYLQRVTYDEDGWVSLIRLPKYEHVEVIVNPRINGGRATVARRGVAVGDVVDRAQAGEPLPDLAYDYDLTIDEVEALTTA